LLAAPEFLVAVGLGVGLTVVMFGGYKIIKRIRESGNNDKEESMDEMLELGELGELNRIEHWRRGIADAETASVATSVEAEFITPVAAVSMGHLPMDGRVNDLRSGHKSRRRRRREGGESGERSERRERRERSDRSDTSSRSSVKPSSSVSAEDQKKAVIKIKKPSPLRKIFRRDDRSSTKS